MNVLLGCACQEKHGKSTEIPAFYLVCDSIDRGPDGATAAMEDAMSFSILPVLPVLKDGS